MLEFNPLYYEKNHVRKYHLIFFFWNFIKDFFFHFGGNIWTHLNSDTYSEPNQRIKMECFSNN